MPEPPVPELPVPEPPVPLWPRGRDGRRGPADPHGPFGPDDAEDEPHHAEPRPIDRFRGTAVGTVLAAGLLGVADALEGHRDEEVAVVADDSGDPPFTDPIVLRLDPDNPQDSIVMVRPWLRATD